MWTPAVWRLKDGSSHPGVYKTAFAALWNAVGTSLNGLQTFSNVQEMKTFRDLLTYGISRDRLVAVASLSFRPLNFVVTCDCYT